MPTVSEMVDSNPSTAELRQTYQKVSVVFYSSLLNFWKLLLDSVVCSFIDSIGFLQKKSISLSYITLT